jgi:hypothetical protein
VFGDAFEAGNSFFFFAGTDVEIAQHIQGGQIVGIVIDNLPVLLDCGVDLSLRKEFLSGF